MAAMTADPVQKHRDDFFFSGMGLLILGTVFIGFARTYFLAGAFVEKG
jgi:hypothetical protein